MNELLSQLRQNDRWTISVPRLVLYVVSVLLFYGLCEVYEKFALKNKSAAKPAGALLLFLLSSGLYFAGAAGLVALARMLSEQPLKAMLILPLVLIVEKHVRTLRANPAERASQLVGIAGAGVGFVAGVYVFMRAAAWH